MLSLLVNPFGVIVVNNLGFSHNVPVESKSQVGNALTEFFEDKGGPTIVHMDSAKEFMQGYWQDILSQHGGIKQTFAKPYSPCINSINSMNNNNNNSNNNKER